MQDILIVEDDKGISRILELELQHEGYSCVVVNNGRKALDVIENTEFALVLLDLMLPEVSGMEVCRRIRRVSNVPIIMLTARRDLTDKIIGLDLGADDYITKPFEMEELLARIRSNLRKGLVRKSETTLLSVQDLVLNIQTRQVVVAEQLITLTKTEFDLLKYLLENKGVVLTRDQIINHVWGYDFYGDMNILDVYIRYLRKKIDYAFNKSYIQTIRGVGYTILDK